MIAQHVFSGGTTTTTTKYYEPENLVKDNEAMEQTITTVTQNNAELIEKLEAQQQNTQTKITKMQTDMENEKTLNKESEDKMTELKQQLSATQSYLTQIEEERIQFLKERDELLNYPRTQTQMDYVKFDDDIQICITGHSRAGKSTFINTVRDIDSKKKMEKDGRDLSLFAEVMHGVEGTTKATPYKHDQIPIITFWDLPGYGTPKFPNETYLKVMGLRYFNLVILIISDGFGEQDTNIIRELFEHEIPFVVAFNKFDAILKNDLCTAKLIDEETSPNPSIRDINKCKDSGTQLTEFLTQVQAAYDKTHQRMTTVLESKYIEDAFFISSHYANRNIYDMPQLIETMKKKIVENIQNKQKKLALFSSQNQSYIDALKKMEENKSIITN